MRLKLDENLRRLAAEILRESGHDVETVPSQNLKSASDQTLIDKCRAESRCLITLDLDFGNPIVFRPKNYSGIVVLRLPSNPSHDDLIACIGTLNAALAMGEVAGKLWIIQRGRIRQYQDPAAEL
jgi:predicted nuclease of predicted toxin-antitoxin system